MRELLGEPVLAAESVYRSDDSSFRARNKCWRYYYEESFWDEWRDTRRL